MNFDVPLFHGITVVGTDDLNYRISTGGDIDESQTKSLPKDAHENNGESYLNILEPITPTKEKQGLVCQVNGLYHNKQSDTYQDALAILKIIVKKTTIGFDACDRKFVISTFSFDSPLWFVLLLLL